MHTHTPTYVHMYVYRSMCSMGMIIYMCMTIYMHMFAIIDQITGFSYNIIKTTSYINDYVFKIYALLSTFEFS